MQRKLDFVASSIEALGAARMLLILKEFAATLPCAHRSWLEPWQMTPESRRFPVFVSNSVGILAIAHISEGYSGHNFASLQQASRRILHQPPFRLESVYYEQSSSHNAVCQLQISRRFGRGPRTGVLCAGRTRPDEIVRSRLDGAPFLPIQDVRGPGRVEFLDQIERIHLKPVSFQRAVHRPSPFEEDQRPHLRSSEVKVKTLQK